MAEEATNEETKNDQMKTAREQLEKLINEPISEDEAKKSLANLEIQKAQLLAYRDTLSTRIVTVELEISQIDSQITAADAEEALIRRRLLNKEG